MTRQQRPTEWDGEKSFGRRDCDSDCDMNEMGNCWRKRTSGDKKINSEAEKEN